MTKPFIKPLTSLRLFFALMVLFSHCYAIAPHFSHYFYLEGFVGVGFFFVLTGFIIAYNYEEKFEQKKSTKSDFWLARFARIYPLHFGTLILFLITGGYLLSIGLGTVAKFVLQIFLLHPLIPNSEFYFSLNAPSWSLGCEMVFYLLYPLVILKISNTRNLFWILIISIFIIPLGMSFTPDEFTRAFWYVNPITRLPDFLIGILIFKIYNNKLNSWNTAKATFIEIGALILFAGFYFFGAKGILPEVYRFSIYYWIPISIIIYVFAINKGKVSHLLSNRFLVLGGEISFGIYLIHLAVIKLYCWTGLNFPWQIAIVLILLIVWTLSYISFTCFEKPMNKYIKKKYKKKEERQID